MKKNILFGFMMLSVFHWAFAEESGVNSSLKNQLKGELQYISSIFSNFYAPRGWKEEQFKWNIADELAKAEQHIDSAQSVGDYRQAVVNFLNSTKDYHVGFSFYSTEKAQLPFLVKTVENKTIVVFIDQTQLSSDQYGMQTGDELVAIDGVPVEQLRESLRPYVGNNVETTDSALVDFAITSRQGRRNMPVPQGPVLVSFRSLGSSQVNDIQLAWNYTPDITSQYMGTRFNFQPRPNKFEKMMISRDAEIYNMGNPFGVGNRESFFPSFGTRIWETEKNNNFDAYIYQNEKGQLIGVIRIANYTPEDADAATLQFAQIVYKMQKMTSGLIIDQVNNPGGSVFYLYALASILTDKGLVTPRHRMALTDEAVNEVATELKALESIKNDEDAVKMLGETIGGYPVSYQFVNMVRSYCRFMLSEWKQKKKLTAPYYIWGVDRINPHPVVRYTKPIVILINELDFSGGDFFPAIMQDNKRAKIVGVRTSGAGGYVHGMQVPNSFGLASFSYTGSIAERVSKNPIENLGVTPDVYLPMTLDDYLGGFQNYIKVVEETLAK